jgi:serine/threonine-protein kinase
MVDLEIDTTERGSEPVSSVNRFDPAAPPLPVGAIVAERYRIERFIDEGGMAQVFEATNLELDERVALKLAHPGYRSTPELVARFRAEARALARIRSEHVARVFDVVATDTGDPVMVMELLEGENLARLIERKAFPTRETMVGWMIEACDGLAVAHANGIVHRDVKPGNLFITSMLGGRRKVKVLDFGISRLALAAPRVIQPGTKLTALKLFGTPMYMAPEQILSSHAADPRIDVWSIGVVLFELLTGEAPFTGKTEEICAQIIEGRVPDVLARRPDLEPGLAAVVERCLQRDATRRFPSVADLSVALLPFAPTYHVSSVDHTVNVLRAAGLTTVDVPAVISLRPSRAGDSMSDTLPSIPPEIVASGSVAPAPLPSARPAPGSVAPPPPERSRWMIPAAIALLAVVLGVGLMSRRTAPAAAPPAPVEMRFETDPPGALMEIDGAAAGMSPAGAALLPGRHVVTFTKPGFERFSTVVDVSAQVPGQSARFPLAAQPAPRVDADPTARATARPAEERPAPRSDRPGRAAAPPVPPPGAAPAAAPPPVAPANPTTRPTVKVIDDSPSTTRVIQ